MTEKKEPKKEPKNEQVQFSKTEVTKLLKEQIEACKQAIDGDNLSQYTARKKIGETKLVK